jgi:hypothetical protein
MVAPQTATLKIGHIRITNIHLVPQQLLKKKTPNFSGNIKMQGLIR